MFSTYFKREKSQGVDFSESPTLTDQHFKDECNMQHIVQRALHTGCIDPSLVRSIGKYVEDGAAVGTFLEAQRIVARGKSVFEQLPSDMRNRFHNSPVELLHFLQQPENRDEAVKMGFFKATSPVSPAVGTDKPLDITVPTDTNTDASANV